jgi:hypothetical protein
VVRLAGFEPTTPWFVAKYSIQLSYSRTQKRDYRQTYLKKEGLEPIFAGFRSPSCYLVHRRSRISTGLFERFAP